MDRTIECSCGNQLDVPEELFGEKAKCPECSSVIEITEEEIPVLKVHEKRESFSAEELFKHVIDSVVGISNNIGYGSGFFMDDQGVIVTNRHVIGVTRDVTIKLNDSSEHKGQILRSYKSIDLAFIKINAENANPPTIDNTVEIEVGETVYAIGHPFGLENTLTQGIVSSVSRLIKDKNYIQTDASINPGNSGGPLFNSYGEAVGVNTLGISGSDIGLNFAIPINTVLEKYAEIIQDLDSILKMTYCSYCGKNSTSSKYCSSCGSEISSQEKETDKTPEIKTTKKETTTNDATGECKACKHQNAAAESYCSSCGASL